MNVQAEDRARTERRKTKETHSCARESRRESIKFALDEIEIRPSMTRYKGRLIMPSRRSSSHGRDYLINLIYFLKAFFEDYGVLRV